LDELASLENAKFSALQDLGISHDSTSTNSQALKLVDFLTAFDREVASRLLHIQEGTLVLMSSVRDITRVNWALAVSALRRASSLQAHLLKAYQFPLSTHHAPDRGSGELMAQSAIESFEITSFSKGQTALPAIFAAIIAARDALSEQDPGAISCAVGNLQSALEGIAGYLQIDEAQERMSPVTEESPLTGAASPGALEGRAGASLVEMIADLYHQENAYQASLRASNRMLALG
jgi:hypothetical protein